MITVVVISSVPQSCPTLCNPMNQGTPGLPVYHQLLEFTQTHVIESVMPPNHLIFYRPLLLLPSIFPSIRVFSNESALHIRWPKCWSFSFNISPSNEHPGLISFRVDWLGLLAVQGTLRSLLQYHSSKASILQRSTFCMVQLSELYVSTGKTIALTIQTCVSKVCLYFGIWCLGLLELFFQGASFNFVAAVTVRNDFGAQENKICQFPLFSLLFAMK